MERICTPWELLLEYTPFEKGVKTILIELPPLKVYPFSLNMILENCYNFCGANPVKIVLSSFWKVLYS